MLLKKTMINIDIKLALHACVSHIWIERNSRLHVQKFRSIEAWILAIIHDIENRAWIFDSDMFYEESTGVVFKMLRDNQHHNAF